MLRAERGLHEEGDVRALLADPLAPADIVSVLRAAGATYLSVREPTDGA
jgi:hypothetical protein